MKDMKSFRENGGDRRKESKRLLLGNLKELHKEFCKKSPEIKIFLTKFQQLACFLVNCQECPGVENAIEKIAAILEQENTSEFTCTQWLTVDRCSFKTNTETTGTFLQKLEENLPIVLKHDFVAKAQSSFLNKLKESISEGEFIATLDFSENYSFHIQDAIQSFHWDNSQATLHVYVTYYKQNNVLENDNFVVISENVKHSAASVELYNRRLIQHLKAKFEILQLETFFIFLTELVLNTKTSTICLLYSRMSLNVELVQNDIFDIN